MAEQFNNRESDVVCAINIVASEERRIVGVATFYTEAKRITVCELTDNELFTGLEAVLVQTRPRSLCIAVKADSSDAVRVRQMAMDLCEEVNMKSKADCKDTSLTEDLRALVTDSRGGEQRFRSALVLLDRHPASRPALACLIRHFDLLGESSYARALNVSSHRADSFLQLDRAALLALGVFPSSSSDMSKASLSASSTSGSLFSILNRTRTAMGSRRLALWLSQPLIDPEMISMRHDVVEALNNCSELRQTVQGEHLRRLPDLGKLAVKMRGLSAAVSDIKELEANGKSTAKLMASASKLFDLEGLVKVYDSLCVAHTMLDTFENETNNPDSVFSTCGLTSDVIRSSWETLVMSPLRNSVTASSKLMMLVEKTVDLKESQYHRYVINRNMDAAFAEVAEKRDGIIKKIHAERDKMQNELNKKDSSTGRRSSTGGEVMKLIRDKTHGYLLRVPKKNHPVVSKMSSCKSVTLNKAEFLFTTNTMVDLVKLLKGLEVEYEKLQNSLAFKATSVASTYAPVIERLASILSEIDVFCGFALVSSAAPAPYCRPVMVGGLKSISTKEEAAIFKNHIKTEENTSNSDQDNSSAGPPKVVDAEEKNEVESGESKVWISGTELILKGSRHPVVEATAHAASALASNHGEFIANDAELSKEDGKSRLLVITGPNMGGKSTYIRQVALCCLMAQIGCLIPAESATLPVLRQILCRVGASDLQLKGISTFFHEMAEASAILRAATPDALVIVDELGRGTSTYDGFGLAWAIARDLADRCGCFSLFATHFHEISGLSQVPELNNRVSNVHVSANVDSKTKSITFLYKIAPGGCELSYGVDVAAIAGVPERVVKRAREKVCELETAETFVANLKRSRTTTDTEMDQDDQNDSHQDNHVVQLLTNLFSAHSEEEFEKKCNDNIDNIKEIAAQLNIRVA